MYRLLITIVALILYGSLYPWDLHFHRLDVSPLAILLGGWPTDFNRFVLRDLVINVLLYLPLGLVACLTPSRRLHTAVRVAFAVALGGAISTAVELLQIFDVSRNASAFDIVCNLAGSLAGAGAASLFASTFEAALTRRTRDWKTAPAAFALLAVWAAVELYPIFPSFNQHALFGHLDTLLHTPIALALLPLATAEWLAAAIFIEVALPHRTALRYLALGLLLPARLLVAGPPVSVTDCAAFCLAFALWRALPRQPRYRHLATAALLLAALVFDDLRPYRFSPAATPFGWIPFGGLLGMDWIRGGAVLVRKAYDYGAAVALFSLAGAGYLRAGLLIAAHLAALEFVQRWLPGRTAEITDPILALLLAGALWLLDHHYRPESPRIPLK